jgi:hypothetical protein
LFVFQGAMVWNLDPGGELAEQLEWGAIGMVTSTCVLAFYTEIRVYRRRHGVGTYPRDDGKPASTFDNPMNDAITLKVGEIGISSIQDE